MAKEVINKIRIDLDRQKIRTSVSICKGDTLSRVFYITLLNSGVVYEIDDKAIATLFATKPDGKQVYNDCAIIGNEVVYTVTNQLITTEGDVECQIKITHADGTEVNSPPFVIRVYEKLFDESILESTNDYQALQTYCIRAEEAYLKAEKKLNEMDQIKKSFMSEYQEKLAELEETAHKIIVDDDVRTDVADTWSDIKTYELVSWKKYLVSAKICKQTDGNGNLDMIGIQVIDDGNGLDVLTENTSCAGDIYDTDGQKWSCTVSCIVSGTDSIMIDALSTNTGECVISTKILELR